MSNKYIGHSGGLIGPVTVQKPELKPCKSASGSVYLSGKSQTALDEYNQHLASLPRIPCEGWTATPGQVYEEWVHFRRDEIITLESGKEISRRIVAVPLTAPVQPVTERGDVRPNITDFFTSMSEAHKDYGISPNLFCYVQALDNYIDKLEQSTTYPAEFVEWAIQHVVGVVGDWYIKDEIPENPFTASELFTEWNRIQSQSK